DRFEGPPDGVVVLLQAVVGQIDERDREGEQGLRVGHGGEPAEQVRRRRERLLGLRLMLGQTQVDAAELPGGRELRLVLRRGLGGQRGQRLHQLLGRRQRLVQRRRVLHALL